MKKIVCLTLLTLFCCSCDNANVPSDIKNFVNAIDFRVVSEHLKSGEFKQTYIEHINGVVSGENSIDFTFSKIEDELYFKAVYSYSGDQIKDEITSKIITLTYLDVDTYSFSITKNEVMEEKQINYQEAYNYYYKIFDSGTNPYRFGGLYYGDYFAINMNKYFKLYSLNEDKSVLTLKEENAKYYDNLLLSQKIDIDKNGMLLYKEEFAYQPGVLNDGKLVQSASYIYD